MEYFSDYLDRLNIDGDDFPSRVQGRREKRFRAFLKRTVYSSDQITDEAGNKYIGSIHPTKDSEKTCIYTFMSLKKDVFNPGQLITNDGNTWLITHKTLDDTLGYNKYLLMYLPTILTITDGDEKFSFPARITNDSAEAIEDFFSTLSSTNRSYREPDRNIKVICKNYDYFKKDQKTMIEGDTFKIEGINKTAVPGCIYLTLGQCLTDAALSIEADDTDNSFWG
jgi:hypothetical protein